MAGPEFRQRFSIPHRLAFRCLLKPKLYSSNVSAYVYSLYRSVGTRFMTTSKPKRLFIRDVSKSNKITPAKVSREELYRPLGYERVYLPLFKVADTPFHIQGDELYSFLLSSFIWEVFTMYNWVEHWFSYNNYNNNNKIILQIIQPHTIRNKLVNYTPNFGAESPPSSLLCLFCLPYIG